MEKPAVIINDILVWKSPYYELVRSILCHNFADNVDFREYVIREKSSGSFFKATALVMQPEIAFSAFEQVFPYMQHQVEFSYADEQDHEAIERVEKQMTACREIFKPEKIKEIAKEIKETEL